jgi:hypothetical protein
VSGGSANRSFESRTAIIGAGGVNHHIAFINDISYNSLQGYDTNEGGLNKGGSTPGTDYFAVVGSIAENSSSDPICLAAIDPVGLAPYDSKAGTHTYITGNFAWANYSSSCVNSSDSEAFMLDTPDTHGYTGQTVFSNNVAWRSMRQCIQTTYGGTISSRIPVKIYNNTCYGDSTNIGSDWTGGEIGIGSFGATIPWVTSIYNNIALTDRATSGSGGYVYALQLQSPITSVTVGGAAIQNIFYGRATGCTGDACDYGNNVAEWGNSLAQLGANTYVNPAFRNTADLISNRSGVPNCSGFTNVTACMGWNANTSTLATASVISDLVPTATGTAGKGYQLPSTTCAANADYPTWLKGVVYLHWNGSALSENRDLVTKPCNM